MQRKVYVPGLAMLLVTLVAGCTSSTGDDDSGIDAKQDSPSPTAAPPGKYHTLREPCGSVDRTTLRDLLPGVAPLPEEQREKVYRGTAAVTYDTDRRVGCSWTSDAPDASHVLVIDLERVVSYDPGVSDEDRAQEVYAKKEDAAELPPPVEPSADTPEDPSSSSPPSGTTSGAEGSVPPSEPTDPTESAESTDGETILGIQPRLLDDLGDAAFVDDVFAPAGSAAKRRTVSVVFRTSNVVVTVRYAEQPAHASAVPDSRELQEKARGLARKLAEQLNE